MKKPEQANELQSRFQEIRIALIVASFSRDDRLEGLSSPL
jgi:hypothetical protein